MGLDSDRGPGLENKIGWVRGEGHAVVAVTERASCAGFSIPVGKVVRVLGSKVLLYGL